MKKIHAFLFLAAVWTLQPGLRAQVPYGPTIPTYIVPFPIQVAVNKTTNLLFHYRIRQVDRGSNKIIAQQVNDTALLVKAASDSFRETNLSVYTSDGKLYSFLVDYAPFPAHLNILVHLSDTPLISADQDIPILQTDDAFEFYARKVSGQPRMWRGHRDKAYGVSVRLPGIYVRSNVLFLPVQLHNWSNVDFDISELRFFIHDQKRVKRTATQELELKPLYVLGNASSVPGKSRHTAVFVLPKFTIPDNKYVTISVLEKNGGRNLQLKIYNRSLVQAETIQ